MQPEANYYTLITGASHGIGKALSMECASRKMNLILVALPGPDLVNIVHAIRKNYDVDVVYIPIDLTETNAPEKVFNWVKDNELIVNMLINNVGIGASGLFEYIGLDEYLMMIRLNNEVLVSLTYHFLPELKKQPKAYILNMSSLEAFLPLPYKAVYAGTKNFVYSYSLALREELKDSNVSLSVVCPGPVITNREGLLRIKSHGKHSKAIVLLPKHVARAAIFYLLKGKGVIVPGFMNIAITRLVRILPVQFKMSLLERMFRVYRTHRNSRKELSA